MAVQQKEQDKFLSTTHRITELPQLLVRHLKCSLCLLALPRESLGYTTLMGVQTYLSFPCNLYLYNYWATLHL